MTTPTTIKLLRITLSSDCLYSDVKEFILKNFDSYLMCYEEGTETNKPHVHAYVETNELVKDPALRARIRKLAGTGNGIFSMKDAEEKSVPLLAYLMKQGDYEHKGIPESVLKESLTYDEKVKSDLREKKRTKRKLIDKLIEYVETRKQIVDPLMFPSRRWIMEQLVDYHIEINTLIRESNLIVYTDHIRIYFMNQLPENDVRRNNKYEIVDRIMLKTNKF